MATKVKWLIGVKFLKKGSQEVFSSDKEYFYSSERELPVGAILKTFKRKDRTVPYSSSAKVTKCDTFNEIETYAFDMAEIEVLDIEYPRGLREQVAGVNNVIGSIEFAKDLTCVNSSDITSGNITSGVSWGTFNVPSLTVSNGWNTWETTVPTKISTSPYGTTYLVNNNIDSKEKEEKNMNINSMFKNMNFEFGKVTGNTIAYSIKGMAVGTDVGTSKESYKTFDGEITDVTGLVIKDLPLYKMPVAIKDINEGDIVIHQNKAVIVEVKNDDGTLLVVDVANATELNIFPVKNIFGFNFYTKIVNPFEGMMGGADPDNPFGNILPLLMFSENGDKNDMMMMFMMMQGGIGTNSMNNILPLLVMGDSKGDMKDIAMMMMLMNNGFTNKIDE